MNGLSILKNAVFWLPLCFLVRSASAQVPAPEKQLILPIVAVGGVSETLHFSTTFTFFNFSDTTFDGAITVFNEEGNIQTEAVFCPDDVIPSLLPPSPDRVVHLSERGLFQLPVSEEVPFFAGWAQLTSPDGSSLEVQATSEVALLNSVPRPCPPGPICTHPSTEILTSVQIPAVVPANGFRGAVIITPNRHTVFAIVNPSPTETAHIDVTLLDDTGKALEVEPAGPARASYQLPPQQRLAGFTWDLVFDPCQFTQASGSNCSGDGSSEPPLPEAFHGSILISADHPIAVAGLQLLFPEGKLVNAEVTPFEPNP